MRVSVRFCVVSQLPAIIKESPLRVEGKTSHFNRLFVHGKVSFIQLPSGTQTSRAQWVLPRSWPRLRLVVVWSSSSVISPPFVCWMAVLLAGVGVVRSAVVHCCLVGKRAMKKNNYTDDYSFFPRLSCSLTGKTNSNKNKKASAHLFYATNTYLIIHKAQYTNVLQIPFLIV